MARRRESVLDLFLILPWWASAIAGVSAYLLLQFAAPAYFAGNVYTSSFGTVARTFAPYALALFAITGIASWVRSAILARKFDRQNGLDDIRHLSWRQFEAIVGEAFRRRGYLVLENARDGADGGIDLVLRKDSQKFYVQCKQWKQLKVGVKPIRELLGVITAGEAAGGFFVASGEYTLEAREFARTTSIELIDGARLARMIEEARAPAPFMDPTARRREHAVAAHAKSAEPTCPSCGGDMVRRTAKRGPNPGANFWGCAQYPQCRGTRAA